MFVALALALIPTRAVSTADRRRGAATNRATPGWPRRCALSQRRRRAATTLPRSARAASRCSSQICPRTPRRRRRSRARRRSSLRGAAGLGIEVTCDRPRDGRPAHTRQSAQSEDAPLIFTVCPAVYLIEENGAYVGEVCRLMLHRERVKRRVFGA